MSAVMRRLRLSFQFSDLILVILAVAFTAMGFFVDRGLLPAHLFLLVPAGFLLAAVFGMVVRWDARAFLSASVLGGALLLAFATVSFSKPTPLEQDIASKVKLAAIVFPIALLLLAGLRMLWQETSPPRAGFPPLAAALLVGGYSFAALCLHWLKFYPSGTSPDTRHQWGQIHGTLTLNDIHALGHTVFLKGLLAIWDSYAFVILVHILMISLLYALFAHYLAGKGIPLGWMLLGVSLFTACGTLSWVYMYPWKDTPYTFAVGILTLMLIHLTDERMGFGVPKAVLLGISLAYTTLFRLNGVVILLFVGGWLAVWYIRRRRWRQLCATALAVFTCFGAVNFYGYKVLKAESPANGFSVQVFASGLSAVVSQSVKTMTPEERQELSQLLPTKWMIEHYAPWDTKQLIWQYETFDPDGIFDDPNMEIMVNKFVLTLGEKKGETIKLYLKLAPKHLAVCIRDILYNTYRVWGFSSWNQFFYENIFLLVLLMVGVGAVWRRKEMAARLAVFAPVVLNAVSIAISTITNEERYLLPSFTLFPVLLLYLFSTARRPLKTPRQLAFGNILGKK